MVSARLEVEGATMRSADLLPLYAQRGRVSIGTQTLVLSNHDGRANGTSKGMRRGHSLSSRYALR